MVQMQYLLLDAGNMPAASYPVDPYVDTRVNLASFYQHFTLGGIIVNNTGNYYPAIKFTGMTAGQLVSLDDIEVRGGEHTGMRAGSCVFAPAASAAHAVVFVNSRAGCMHACRCVATPNEPNYPCLPL